MKALHLITCGLFGLLSVVTPAATAQETDYTSIKVEIERAIARGNEFLKTKQDAEGHWGNTEFPAFTAMALQSAVRAPGFDLKKPLPEHLDKGFKFLLSKQQANGGIYHKQLACYNTSASMMAMLATGKEEFVEPTLKARRFLVSQQADFDAKDESDNALDGGIGYGSTFGITDLSNTHLSLEAIHYSKHLAVDSKYGKQPELNWDAALKFVTRCQNLKETNDQEWASDNEEVEGGFVYNPASSKAGTIDLGGGRTALRSYGSMSYAGLLSLVFADLDESDPRVAAVKKWLGRNYTVEENPGMGQQGLYYYYHAMAKSLAASNVKTLKLEDGKEADWRSDLATKLVSGQREDGSWVNDNNRWWESDPILVTTYAVMALEQIYYSIPQK